MQVLLPRSETSGPRRVCRGRDPCCTTTQPANRRLGFAALGLGSWRVDNSLYMSQQLGSCLQGVMVNGQAETDGSQLLNTREAAKVLGLTESTLNTYRSRGVGPTFKRVGVGPQGRIRYRASDLQAFVRDGSQQESAGMRSK
jgi:hypothetical protein